MSTTATSLRLFDGSAIRITGASVPVAGNVYAYDEDGNDRLITSSALSGSRPVDAKLAGGDRTINVKP